MKRKQIPLIFTCLLFFLTQSVFAGYEDFAEADHITPWRDGGRTVPANCQMLCKDCNRRKGAK